MKNKPLWLIVVTLLVIGGGAYLFRSSLLGTSRQTEATPEANQTVAVRPATDSFQVSAAGNIALVAEKSVAFQGDGQVVDVLVAVGDAVMAGDLLARLESDDLERAVQRAELAVETSQNAVVKLRKPADPADVASAKANLVAAQEKSKELQAGPSAAELAAAEAALAAAQNGYEELLTGSSEAELTQLSADLHKAFITLAQAQEAYNEIAYTDTVGASSQAMTLQEATIDYDVAKAGYDIATEPASEAEVQDALKTIKQAQVDLEALAPTRAELAEAEAGVSSAAATLADLLNGAAEADIREAELAVEQAQIDLAEAAANLDDAQLRSPIDGVITTLELVEGESPAGAVKVADLAALELTVNVAEVDIGQVALDQPAQIGIDAFPDRTFSGVVSRIAPTSSSDSGVVNYEITIRLDNLNLDGVRPGMTAVATLADDGADQAWLVPTNALVEAEGEMTVVVMRNGQRTRVTITPGSTQGEWTVVQSPELQAGDRVAGSVTSFLDEDGNGGSRGPFGPPR